MACAVVLQPRLQIFAVDFQIYPCWRFKHKNFALHFAVFFPNCLLESPSLSSVPPPPPPSPRAFKTKP